MNAGILVSLVILFYFLKIDKIKKSDYAKQLEKMSDIFHPHKVIPYSAEKKIGVVELSEELSKGA